jgi:hypothetical protein
MLRKVYLSPTLGVAHLSDSLAQRHTDICCHGCMVGLAFALYLAYALSGERKVPNAEMNCISSSFGNGDALVAVANLCRALRL